MRLETATFTRCVRRDEKEEMASGNTTQNIVPTMIGKARNVSIVADVEGFEIWQCQDWWPALESC